MAFDRIDYDPQQALEIARSIAEPRLVGTQRELAVGRELAGQLEASGFQVTPEEFQFTDAHSIALLIEILLSQVLILTTIWLHIQDVPAQAVSAALLILLLLLSSPINRAVQKGSLFASKGAPISVWSRLCHSIGKNFTAINYVARLPGELADPSRTHLTLLAHYDSKSQRMPLAVRMTLFVLGMGGGLVFALLVLLSPLWDAVGTAALAVGLLAFLASLPLLSLDLGNDSPGAIDNASGIGVVMHLAQALAQHPEMCEQLDLTILLTSAEEVSTMGAMAYVHKHEALLRQQAKFGRAVILNFDGVGVDGSLRWVGNDEIPGSADDPCLVCLVRQACIELDEPLKRFNLPGALYDHIPFASLGLDAGTLVAVSRQSLSIHTPRDNSAQLHVRGFERAGQVAVQVIHKLLALPDKNQPILG